MVNTPQVDPDVVKELTKNVSEYAAFWDKNNEDLSNIGKELLKDFCEKATFDSDQYTSYRDGIASVFKVFELCLLSVEKAAKE
ncbi:hypothetical protein HN682_08060 [Candidatus Peregrinibacteria bacterium]|jgi:hypothetical protein|nr:hypothetical protein [Candidatus Peregrinibacteria bacterium]